MRWIAKHMLPFGEIGALFFGVGEEILVRFAFIQLLVTKNAIVEAESEFLEYTSRHTDRLSDRQSASICSPAN